MLTGAWILALLMAGAPLLAAAGGGGDESDDPAEAPDPPQDEAAEADAEPSAQAPTGETEEDLRLPTDFEFILGSGGDHDVDGFRPGTDTLTLTSGTWDFDLYDLGDEGNGAALRIAFGAESSLLRFPDLGSLPIDDLYLKVLEPGAEAQRIPLRDLLDPETEDVLAPTDPDAPDERPEPDLSGPPLSPADPDAPDALPPDESAGPVLSPTDPDAPEERTPPP